MKPTRPWVLLVAVLGTGIVAFFATGAWYADVPSPQPYAPAWLAVLGLGEAYTAYVTRARLGGRPGTKPIEPLFVARLAAFAKASSLVGSVLLGGYAGFLVQVLDTDSSQAHTDTRTAVIGLICSAVLVTAGLALEQVCRIRRPRDDDPTAGG